ncbi:MAG: PD40 domain-containing protein [Gemmatimonadota bacterium]|nr:MAG: PD40 domain-containing protein [Gemmatimonadota bacterium]
MRYSARVFASAIVLTTALALLFAGAGTVLAQTAGGEEQEGVLGYYRYPALHGDTIVFAAEGDLWKVSAAGGVARRLTTHHSEEDDPVISPNGRTLAFTARYEGPAELYTMPLAGGVPVRRSYEAESSVATTWTPDGRLVYTTTHYSGLPKRRLVTLNLENGTRSLIPLAEGSEATYDGTGTKLFFVRPAFHGNVTKRYTGGTARDVWKFEEGAAEAVELTGDYDGESHSPMWWAGRVYFVTDRDGTMNVWSMDEDGGDLRQHTRHSGWDVKDPSLSQGRIAYQLGADLWLYDISTGDAQLVPITLASDFDQLREKWVDDPMSYLTSAHIHPEGASVVLTARGRVFVAPAEQGRLVRASRKEGVRYRGVVFMPDGETLLGLSDETGELEFVKIPANGVGDEEPLTDDGMILRFRGYPSPDGAWIAYDDNNRDLWVLNVATGEGRRISENREGIRDMAWSPDSRWLAFTMRAKNSFTQIKLYSVEDGTTVPLTSDRVNSFSVAWDPDGEFIYFLSDRNLRSLVGSPWGSRQPEPYFDRSIEIFHVALQRGLRSPFKPDDELSRAEGDDGGGRGRDDSDGESDEAAPIHIELDGLQRRVKQVPVAAGNFSSLYVTKDALFWRARDSGPGADSHLMALEIGNKDFEPTKMVEDVGSFELSLDGEKVLLAKGDSLYVIDARPSRVADLGEHRVDLGGWTFPIDVREDWRQIFVDAWRLERDYFYDPNMHGVDWDATLQKYLPLVDRVTTRDELSDLIGRVVGELSALHTSVRGGDLRRGDEDIQVPTLGARLLRDPEAGGYRIDYIYQSDPDYPDEMSPLADPDLDVQAGDVIEAVNGVGTLLVPDIGALLRNQQGRQVLLTVRSGGSVRAGESRDLIVVPTTGEFNLRYSDWEYARRQIVEEAGAGKIGYVHLRAMGWGDITKWYREFYPVFNRQALIIDVRHNRGGNIDSFILEKLMRQAWMYWKSRAGQPTWNMQYAFRGHMVVLVDQNTASDGEAFADGFRRLGLGEVIGMRTWGGEIWLSSTNRLSDGGLARAPMTGVYGPEGEWLIEQIGVVPDIVVDNLPHATFNGSDAQLDAAIEYLLGQIENDPRSVPPPPAYPNRAFEYPVTESDDGGS